MVEHLIITLLPYQFDSNNPNNHSWQIIHITLNNNIDRTFSLNCVQYRRGSRVQVTCLKSLTFSHPFTHSFVRMREITASILFH